MRVLTKLPGSDFHRILFSEILSTSQSTTGNQVSLPLPSLRKKNHLCHLSIDERTPFFLLLITLNKKTRSRQAASEEAMNPIPPASCMGPETIQAFCLLIN